MKEIFDTVRTALMTLGYWKMIDANDGQTGDEEFALLPAALIDVVATDWVGGGDKLQVGMLDFNVEYVWRKLQGASNLKNSKNYTSVSTRWDAVKLASKTLTGRYGTTHGTIALTRTERKDHKDLWIVKESYRCTVAEDLT